MLAAFSSWLYFSRLIITTVFSSFLVTMTVSFSSVALSQYSFNLFLRFENDTVIIGSSLKNSISCHIYCTIFCTFGQEKKRGVLPLFWVFQAFTGNQSFLATLPSKHVDQYHFFQASRILKQTTFLQYQAD